MKIAILGFIHETNTFNPRKTTYEDFVKADGWPELVEGDALLEKCPSYNIDISGFITRAHEHGFELAPILWCSAEPGGVVEADAFEKISGKILDGLKSQEFDTIYLSLHGAMVTENHPDGEGELLRRIRAEYPDAVITLSLDLHANATQQMVEYADHIHSYRTYPHIDMRETGAACADFLHSSFAGSTKNLK